MWWVLLDILPQWGDRNSTFYFTLSWYWLELVNGVGAPIRYTCTRRSTYEGSSTLDTIREFGLVHVIRHHVDYARQYIKTLGANEGRMCPGDVELGDAQRAYREDGIFDVMQIQSRKYLGEG